MKFIAGFSKIKGTNYQRIGAADFPANKIGNKGENIF